MNLRKRTEILAIASSLCVSAGHARRIWTENGGRMQYICKKSAAMFELWDAMAPAGQQALYEGLLAEVAQNRASGLTTK
jgi:hypothetical protein